jgi:large subunit ribosomal protein L19
VIVHYRIVDGEKERIQKFEGVVLGISGAQNRRTFTVRKVSSNIGVERVFPIHSPRIAMLEIKRPGRVRRAKLYYLRDRRGKAAKIRERRIR